MLPVCQIFLHLIDIVGTGHSLIQQATTVNICVDSGNLIGQVKQECQIISILHLFLFKFCSLHIERYVVPKLRTDGIFYLKLSRYFKYDY